MASDLAREHAARMRLDGWNVIPDGYGARFEVDDAPRWLRLLYRTPFVDRFAYPLLVKRGLGVLSPHPGRSSDRLGPVTRGWRVDSG